jgi:antitoxin VapB
MCILCNETETGCRIHAGEVFDKSEVGEKLAFCWHGHEGMASNLSPCDGNGWFRLCAGMAHSGYPIFFKVAHYPIDNSSSRIYNEYIHFQFLGAHSPMPTAKVFRSGNSQAVRLPKQFRLKSKEVEIFRRGDEVVLREKRANMAQAFDLLAGLPEDFAIPGRENDRPQKRKGL